MAVTHVIVGLGNPGDEYEGSRHNVGFMVVDRIAERLGCAPVRDKKYGALVARGRLGGAGGSSEGSAKGGGTPTERGKGLGEYELLLVKPQGYMNLSGEPTRKALGDAGLPIEDWKEKLIVVHDELDLPVGRMKIQADRGAGGHNGIKSIIGSLGTQAFARVRVGVDKPPKGQGTAQGADWVLSRFKKGEAAAVADAIERAADAVEWMVKKGVEAAATEFNREPKQP